MGPNSISKKIKRRKEGYQCARAIASAHWYSYGFDATCGEASYYKRTFKVLLGYSAGLDSPEGLAGRGSKSLLKVRVE